MVQTLSIGAIGVRNINGLFSLNDLHKASGGSPKHRPGEFFRNEQTKALIAELAIADIPAIRKSAGRYGGTYACKELVIAYAAWISAAFHLKVIRVFLSATAPMVAAPRIEPGLDDLDCRQLESVINHLRSRHDFQAPALREAVLSRFGAQSFAHIPKSRFQDAINILREYAPGANASQVPARAFVAQAGNQITITIN